MTKNEIIEKLESCVEKANLIIKVSTDEDEMANFVVTSDSVYYWDIRLPYSFAEFNKIQYHFDPSDDFFSYLNNYIIINFQNGDFFKLDGDGKIYIKMDNHYFEESEALNMLKKRAGTTNIIYSSQEVLKQIKICLDKAGISKFTVVKQDEDQIVDIGFENGRLFIDGDVLTPYAAEDIKCVRFYDGHKYDEPNSVIIYIRNGESLTLNEYIHYNGNGIYEAEILDGKIMHFYTGSDIRRRFSFEIRARDAGIADDEFVAIDGILFKYNGDSKKIILPEGILKINQSVFEQSDMESITFPSTLKTIDDYAFSYCKHLSSVKFNDGLEVIGNRAFCACESLKRIELPTSLKEIKEFAFLNSGVKSFSHVPDGCIVAEKMFD